MEDMKTLVKKLTFDEKASLLTGFGWMDTYAVERLGIPSVKMSDGPHGVNNLTQEKHEGGTTCFPTASALGATWNRELVHEVASGIAEDCKRLGIDVILGPGVNMKRTPRCGRNFEYFSEDPVLSGELGAAYVQGVQERGVGTSLKHYACNNQEIDRFKVSVEVDERTLREYYLKPFEIVVKKAQPTSVMCAYNKLWGVWCSENKYLLDTILRQEFGFEGMIVSDWSAVHNSSRVVAAGLDLQMPPVPNIKDRLARGLDAGYVTMEEINLAVERVLEFVYRLKDMHQQSVDYDRNAQHELAYRAAIEAITLLKNDDDILPITREKYKKIDVRGLGLFAEKPKIMGGGSSNVTTAPEQIDIPIDYIRKYCEEEGIELVYEPTVNPGRDLDLRVIFVGDGRDHGFETEGENIDRHFIDFCSYVNKEINDACLYCDNVVVIMQVGSAVIPFRWHKDAKGIIQQWYTGEGGGKAIADILFGKVNPSGKLSESFILKERTDLDYPGDGQKVRYIEGPFVGYRYYDSNPVDLWYPFGHGLSYTKFVYRDLKLTEKDNSVAVSFKIKNVGDMAGKEIAQIYVRDVVSTATKPYKELREFVKVSLNPGGETTVNLVLDREKFEYYNPILRRWMIEAGDYEILIGASAADIRLRDTVCMSGDDQYTLMDVKELQWQS